MSHYKKLFLSISAAFVLGACGSAIPLKEDTLNGQGIDNRPEPPRPCCVNPNRPEPDPLNDPQDVLAKRSIYFDYDSYSIQAEFRSLLEAHARYLNTYKSRSVMLMGHADERGSREYNLAIGFKRAEAVRKMLEILGVPTERLESVSYGEEKPAAAGSDEASWAQNRRVVLEYRD